MLDPPAHDDPRTDEDLIALSALGDRCAFDRLVERHAAAVYRLTNVITGDPMTAEDALQQTFLSAYRHAASFRSEASVRTWLLAIARNAAVRLRSKRSKEDAVEESLLQLGLDAGWGTDDPEALAIAAERSELLRSAMADLCAEDQEVLILRDVEGLSGIEAAEVLGIGERALKSRLHRARLRLGVALRAALASDSAEGRGGRR
jgi:RNA polymerase sigma-70 factor (ECF subfamily)